MVCVSAFPRPIEAIEAIYTNEQPRSCECSKCGRKDDVRRLLCGGREEVIMSRTRAVCGAQEEQPREEEHRMSTSQKRNAEQEEEEATQEDEERAQEEAGTVRVTDTVTVKRSARHHASAAHPTLYTLKSKCGGDAIMWQEP